ncbi:hypothetical protein AWB80_01343 [Caballeronia pedi]|uniref:Uncharacterized protein n=1 Tax=Caballeronia pedi TaxID=1777141 RepID=A0A157ZV19_9BURK|nr:hypothetical protein AWB80_01343 [Caballeronia pedi]
MQPLHSFSGNRKPPVFDGDFYALSRVEARLFNPPSSELHPWKMRWLGAQMRWLVPVALESP